MTAEQFSEDSDAGYSIVRKVFASVKKNLSGAKRRKTATTRERGTGRQPLSPLSAHSNSGAHGQRSVCNEYALESFGAVGEQRADWQCKE